MMDKISFQRMKLVAGCIHVLQHAGYVKSSKKSAKLVGMFWLNVARMIQVKAQLQF